LGAAPVDSTEALIERGVELRKTGDDRTALEVFARAFACSGSARAQAQMALAEQALGRWIDAHQHLRAALDAAHDPWIREHTAALTESLAEIASRLGRLEVTANVAGAELSVDGRRVGRTPLSDAIYAVVGESVVILSAPGYFDLARRVTVDAGSLSRVSLHLTRVRPSPLVEAEPAASSAQPYRQALTYGSLGLSAAGFAVGTGGYVLREVNVSIYNDNSRCLDFERDRRDVCSDERSAFRRGEALAIAGFSVAGVFGALGLYLWLSDEGDGDVESVACNFGGASVSCQGTF
jgi:tetratricopeptide (TPR) repeat protein